MATITIKDLSSSVMLDRQALACVRGASGAPWVFGWIRPYVGAASGPAPVINFYQINNYADQMINQFQSVSVINSAPNSQIDVQVDERSANTRHG